MDKISFRDIRINRKYFVIFFTSFVLFILILLFNLNVPSPMAEIHPVAESNALVARKKLLFAFIAINPNPLRNEVIRRNMEMVLDFGRNATEKYIVECIIFARISRADVPEFARNPSGCRTVFLPNARYIDNIFHLDPVFLKAAGVDYVTLSLDDVLLFPPKGNIDLEAYMDTVVSTNLSMSSPLVPGSPHPWMQKMDVPAGYKGAVGHTAPFVEVQFTTVAIDTWACIYRLFDLELSFYWQDAFFHEYCFSNGRGVAGVLNGFTAYHNVTKSTYKSEMDHGEFMDRWLKLHNEKLISNWGKPWNYQFFDRNGRIN